VVTKTVAGFEYHLTVEVVGTEGAIRSWWSGGLDRTRHATYKLKVQRRAGGQPESKFGNQTTSTTKLRRVDFDDCGPPQ
jgi:hypothetical protein